METHNPYTEDERLAAEREIAFAILSTVDDPIGTVETLAKLPAETLALGITSALANIGGININTLTAYWSFIVKPDELEERGIL